MDEIRKASPQEDAIASPDTPEDVAVLYSWANVLEGKYRDFSASRREYRAQQRRKAAEAAKSNLEEPSPETNSVSVDDAAIAQPIIEPTRRWSESGSHERAALVAVTIESHSVTIEPHSVTAPDTAPVQTQDRGESGQRPERVSGKIGIEPEKRNSRSSGHVPEVQVDEPTEEMPSSGADMNDLPIFGPDAHMEAARQSMRESDGERPLWRLFEGEQRGGAADAPRGVSYYDRPPRELRESRIAATLNKGGISAAPPPSRLHVTGDSRATASAAPTVAAPTPAPTASPALTASAAPTLFVGDHGTNHPGSEWRRRRGSTTDLSARTERRPRSMEHSAESFEFGAASYQPPVSIASRVLARELPVDPHEVTAEPTTHAVETLIDASPEWLHTAHMAQEAVHERPVDAAGENTLIAQAVPDASPRRLDTVEDSAPEVRQPLEFVQRAAVPSPQSFNDAQHQREEARRAAEQIREEQQLRTEEAGRQLAEVKMRAVSRRRSEERLRADAGGLPVAEERRAEDRQLRPETNSAIRLRSSLSPLRDRIQPEAMQPSIGSPSHGAIALIRETAAHESAPLAAPSDVPAAITAENAATGTIEAVETPAVSARTDTLQESRERMASRWFGMQGLMDKEPELLPAIQPPTVHAAEVTTPCLAVVSLSGGVGKTSIVATLGRVLSSVGETVLLADTTPFGLLPYYFGARELRPDVVRTFSPPPGREDAPVYMVNYDADRLNGDEPKLQAMVAEIMLRSRDAGQVLLDLNGCSTWLVRLMTRYQSTILVPIAPDMNSVLSIKNVDRFFSGFADGDGHPIAPYYVLNQFDASLPLHLDVREVLRKQLGDRLLSVMIRRSPAVAEALAEGMTVVDYAPDAAVTEDFRNLAEWVRSLSASAPASQGGTRWTTQ